MTEPKSIEIRLFGTPSIKIDGESVPLPSLSISRKLLVYLFLHKEQVHPRSRLLFILAPEQPESRGRRILSRALWDLRRALPIELIEAQGDHIQIDEKLPIWIDTISFSQAAAEQLKAKELTSEDAEAIRESIAFYRGELLEGFYDDWVFTRRDAFKEHYLQMLWRLSMWEKQQGNYQEALDCLHPLVEAEPLRESGHREMMRLYLALGRPDAALQQYETCCRVLEEEFGLEPEEETLQLAEKLKARSQQSPSRQLDTKPKAIAIESTEEMPLIGRAQEREQILLCLEEVMAGKGGVLLLEGEAGIGKTRLLREIANDANWRGIQVLWGHHDSQAQRTLYAPFVEALRGGLSPMRARQLHGLLSPLWLALVGRLLPELADWLPEIIEIPDLSPEEETLRTQEAFIQFFRTLSQLSPTLIFLEDLHWADETTFELLSLFAQQLEQSRILIVGSYRGIDAREKPHIWKNIQAIDRAGVLLRLELHPLPSNATSELIRSGLGTRRELPELEARLFRETEGNPLFILEVLRALYNDKAIYRNDAGEWRTELKDATDSTAAPLPMPKIINEVIVKRLGTLGELGRQVLEIFAISGRAFSLQLLMEVTHRSPEELFSTLAMLLQRHFLEETATDYRFYHDKIRQVVYESLPQNARIRLHSQVLQALHTSPFIESTTLAFHAEQSQQYEQAIQYHIQAGQKEARVHSYKTALHHYESASALVDKSELSNEMLFSLFDEYESILDILGLRQQQEVALTQLMKLTEAQEQKQPEVRQKRGWFYYKTGRWVQAEQDAKSLLVPDAKSSPLDKAHACSLLGTSLSSRGMWEEGRDQLHKAIESYQEHQEFVGEAEARVALAQNYLHAGRQSKSLHEAKRAQALYKQANHTMGQVHVLSRLISIYRNEGKLEEATQCSLEALDLAEKTGYRRGEAEVLCSSGFLLWSQGKIAQMVEFLQRCIEICHLIQDQRLKANAQLQLAEPYRLILGDFQKTEQILTEALSDARNRRNTAAESQILAQFADLHRRQGNPDKVSECLEKCYTLNMRNNNPKNQIQQLTRGWAPFALSQGLPQEAMRHVESARNLSIRTSKFIPDDEMVLLLTIQSQIELADNNAKSALETVLKAKALQKDSVERHYLLPFIQYRAHRALKQKEEAQDAIEEAHQSLLSYLDGFSEEQQATSFECVEEHKEIRSAWKSFQARKIAMKIPRIDVPKGRPVREDEWVEVLWTVETTQDKTIENKKERRQHQLIRLMEEAKEQGGCPTTEHLASALEVSKGTIKRDFTSLRKQGYTPAVRGKQ